MAAQDFLFIEILKSYKKSPNINDYEILEAHMDYDTNKCKECNRSIFYSNSKICIDKITKLPKHKNGISGTNCLSTKKIFGETYYLKYCHSCLCKRFPEYSSMNISRTFNTLNKITRFAFEIPDDIANSKNIKGILNFQNYLSLEIY